MKAFEIVSAVLAVLLTTAAPHARAAQAPATEKPAPKAEQHPKPAEPPKPAEQQKQPSLEDELRAIVNLQDTAARHKALRAFVEKNKTGEMAVAGNFLLVRSLLVAKAPARELADAAKAALVVIPADNPKYFQPRMEVALGVAESLIERGEALDAATELVQTALASTPKDDERAPRIRAVLHVMTAQIQSKQGNREAAITTLKQAAAADPDDQMLLGSLASELEAAGRIDEAIEAHIRAETVFGGDPTDVWPLRELYVKKTGSILGLGERIEKARMESMQRVALESRRVSTPAPDWELTDLSGAKVSLKELRGQVVVLDFWATWCPPCREEVPIIEALNESYAGKPVRILAINVEGSDDRKTWEETVRGFVAENGMKVRVLPDYENKLNEAYGVEALPTVLVIDQEGVIRYRNVGEHASIKQILSAQIGSLAK